LDCPARWEVGEWERCSKSCGSGYKNRTVLCKQTMAQDHKVGRVDSMCPGVKPMETKPCNTKPCDPEDDRPHILTTASRFIQHDPNQKTISLKVGGAATIFYGTQVKIKCPVKKYNRTKIKWSKDLNLLPKTRKYKVSKKGALRILDVTFKDGGVYTCHAGQSIADITLTIKAKPGETPTNNEDEGKFLAGKIASESNSML
jgi:ADAMTS-like protein 1/3